MSRQTSLRFCATLVTLGLVILSVAFSVPVVRAATLADIEILAVSPGTVGASTTDVFDEVSSGLRTVGLGQKVYLEAMPAAGAVIGGYQWAMSLRPVGSTAALSGSSGELVTFRPDREGDYKVTLTPLNASLQATTSTMQTFHAGVWIGAGSIELGATPQFPECSTNWCHGGLNADPDLFISGDWLQSGHSKMLQSFMNGERGGFYGTSCLPCHTVGFSQSATAVNDGFDDVANTLGYDLAQIPTLVADAAANSHQNFALLPAGLQQKSSIQCESCHGPGSQHMPHLSLEDRGLDGADLSAKACRQCHDAPTHHMKFYEWESSKHVHPVEGHPTEEASCTKCHTGEGFVSFRAEGAAEAEVVHEPNGITCSVCHDPHFSENEHQLRVAGDFTLDSGQTFTDAGPGGLCMRCHNSRVSDADDKALTSSRGSHYGPQSDMLLGVNGVSFNLPFEANSYHSKGVPETCVACHMAAPSEEGTAPPKVGGHTYSMRDDMETPDDPSDDELNVENACGTCHGSMPDYDREAFGDYDGDGAVEGTQTEVHGLFDLLRAGILANFAGTSLSETGRISISSDDFAGLTETQKKALYNFNFVWSDGSFGIHNTAYAVQLLQRSYQGVYNKTIDEDYPNVSLRGPVDSDVVIPTNTSGALAKIKILRATPRDVGQSSTDLFTNVASGLNVVGVGQKVYLQAEPVVFGSLGGSQWTVSPSSAAGALSVTGDGSGVVTFQPAAAGKYWVICTPLNSSHQPTTSTVQIVYAGRWIGSGSLNVPEVAPRAPQCTTSWCHGGNNAVPRLNVASDWLKSAHAKVLQAHLNDERGTYRTSCLPCHTAGFDQDPLAVNNGFDDVVAASTVTLAQIAAAAGNPDFNFDDLPATVQEKASVQCESCHGAGSNHPIQLTEESHGIAGANLDPRACAQCHDAPSHHMIVYQWEASKHVYPVEGHASEGEDCVQCHTGEGYVSVRAKGEEPDVVDEPSGITCAACHDPHFSEHEHQLRVLGDFALDSGETVTEEALGLGTLCVRCHNSRVANAETTSVTSSRGAHYGPQTDMWLGVNGIGFGMPFEPNSFHSTGMMGLPGVPDSCVFCHMAEPSEHTATPAKVGGHTWAMRDPGLTPDNQVDDKLNVTNACGACHATLNTYNRRAWGDYDGDGAIEGVQSEVAGLFEILRPGILANFPGTSIGAIGNIEISSSNFAKLTAERKKALYNYNFVWKDGSFGIHNTSYAVQLLQRAYYPIYGSFIREDYPLMTVRGAVQSGAGADEGWMLYQ